MDPASKNAAMKMVWTNFEDFHNQYLKIVEEMKIKALERIEEFKAIVTQIPLAKSAPLIPKTPKISRIRIETIPEDETIEEPSIKKKIGIKKHVETDDEILPSRSKRAASIKASHTIKEQQSIMINTKMRRPSSIENSIELPKSLRSSGMKRPITSLNMNDLEEEKDSRRPAKQSKMDNVETKQMILKPVIKVEMMSESSESNNEPPEDQIQSPVQQNRRSSRKSKEKQTPKVITESLIEPDVTLTEQSMYEDAVGKSIPMNSTMNPNATVTIDKKILNVTVVLEKMDETRIIHKSSINKYSSSSLKSFLPIVSEKLSNEPTQSEVSMKNATITQQMQFITSNVNNPEDLITDDESSPDRVKEEVMKKPVKLPIKKRKKIREIVDDSDEDVIEGSPAASNIKKHSSLIKRSNNKTYKVSALFSPYAKESVKKRVQAFEQARIATPDCIAESSGRMTRTKTRALAVSNDSMKTPNVATKLARKSLAKAKKISLAKQKRQHDNEKENTSRNSSQKSIHIQPKTDKSALKHPRTTPISKLRLQMPMSVSRIPQTPIGSHIHPPLKAMTTSRVHNNASSTESLLSLKPLSKSSSSDSLIDKKNKLINEEDARRKKEETLKAQMEEKRRKREEKELKNKLAREAKEKLEFEKRLKQEKEREEKARNVLLMQEKLRAEMEKKRLAQLQRAQEKEERRRQEEQLKQQRLQEQEETERQLAEEKRREQEAERRKMAETRAQQLAAAEAARLKQHYQAKAKMLQQQNLQQTQVPTTYRIDSDPDDDESDNESKPKHAIPYWARPQIRKAQLEMQQYISIDSVLKYFGAKKSTPDLSELFVGIKKERLKRTSSAVWKTPPRFSMMEDE